MAKLDNILNSGDKVIISSENQFNNSVKLIENKILREVNKLFDIVDVSGGKLQNNPATIDFINSLDARIRKALKSAGYNNAVNDLLTSFNPIKDNSILVQKTLNKIDISPSALNELTRVEVQNTVDRLLGSGISSDFIIPIRQSIYRNIILGTSVKDAQETLRSYIISEDGEDSRLLRYTGQVAEDSLNQYASAIQQKIKIELDLNDFIYFGTLIKDSRCQCIYWVNKTKLPGDELVDEIDIALNGGNLGGCNCSGMIPGTNIDNFAMFKGGYRCRHRAIPTKL
jgi:hypothetical protein